MAISKHTLLDVRNLNVDYFASNGIVHAVRDVSFTLDRGEILGLAGESGCGKSTLAYAIARLHRPPAYITGGQVLYYPRNTSKEDGTSHLHLRSLKPQQNVPQGALDILRFSQDELRSFRWNELSIVFQSAMNALNPVMTIGEQIMDVLQTHQPQRSTQQRKKRATELLDLVGIAADRLRSYPHELSGGMRQRVVIAIALALNPDLIIMDEPTTALDVVVQREILQLISALCREFSTALIFITHDLSLLIELADKISIMYAGGMIEKASSKELYEAPRHPYSFGLLNSFPNLHGARRKMAGIPGNPPDLRKIPSGCTFHLRCPFAMPICHEQTPPLENGVAEHPNQLVACHLYNRALNPAGPPTNVQFVQRYEALAEKVAD